MKNVISGLLVILSCGWVLFHLIMIKLKGKVMIYEDNQPVLITEIIMTTLMVLFGVERFVSAIKEGASNE